MPPPSVVPMPYVGADVWLWLERNGSLFPIAAKIIDVVAEPTAAYPDDAVANLTMFFSNAIGFQQRVPYSPEPMDQHWTWPQVPDPIVLSDTPPVRELAASVVVSEDDGQAD